jgi:hypothetical protein
MSNGKNIKYFIGMTAIILFASKNSFSLEQHESLWLGINSQQILSNDEAWLSYIYSQTRFINQDHPWQLILLEGGIGYKLPTTTSVWLGYRWSGRNPFNDFSEENRLIQQIIYPIKADALKTIIRTRFEEIQYTNQSPMSLRLRQRIAFEFSHELWINKIFPVIYDEVFFQLNKTDYSSNHFISQNRLFLGFNLRLSAKTWWEIGYINQLQMNTPQNNQNQINHILSFTYNFT